MIIYLVLFLIILKNIKFIKEKIEKLREDIYDPFTVVTIMLIWITIIIYILIKYKVFDKEFIELARKVYITNDKRSRIKRKINETFGSELVEEKSYADY